MFGNPSYWTTEARTQPLLLLRLLPRVRCSEKLFIWALKISCPAKTGWLWCFTNFARNKWDKWGLKPPKSYSLALRSTILGSNHVFLFSSFSSTKRRSAGSGPKAAWLGSFLHIYLYTERYTVEPKYPHFECLNSHVACHNDWKWGSFRLLSAQYFLDFSGSGVSSHGSVRWSHGAWRWACPVALGACRVRTSSLMRCWVRRSARNSLRSRACFVLRLNKDVGCWWLGDQPKNRPTYDQMTEKNEVASWSWKYTWQKMMLSIFQEKHHFPIGHLPQRPDVSCQKLGMDCCWSRSHRKQTKLWLMICQIVAAFWSGFTSSHPCVCAILQGTEFRRRYVYGIHYSVLE